MCLYYERKKLCLQGTFELRHKEKGDQYEYVAKVATGKRFFFEIFRVRSGTFTVRTLTKKVRGNT